MSVGVIVQQGLPRGGVLAAIVAIHAALLVAISQWNRITVQIEPKTIQAALISESTEVVERPPVPVPDLVMPDLPRIELPEVPIHVETPPTNAISVQVVHQPPPAPQAAPPAQGPRVVSDVAYIDPPKPKYPPESRRSREEGLVLLRVLIDEEGRAKKIEVHQSSGFRRLDEAARSAVARALFQPYIENGIAYPALVVIPIEFTVNTRTAQARRS